MTSNFDARKPFRQTDATEMDSLQRDRFELLSAYIDGEVTAQERKQVQEWLATDSQMQRLHSKLMKLRQGLHTLPVPPVTSDARDTAQQVFSRLDRRRNRRTAVWGGAAIAALLVSALPGILFSNRSWMPQLAQSPVPETVPEPLKIAVNRPVIDFMPEAAASPENLVEPSILHRNGDEDNFN